MPASAPSVDELFARIRAGSDTDTAGAGVGAPAAGPPEATTEVAGGDGGAVEAPDAPEAMLGEVTAAPAGPDAEIIGRRDELFAPIAGS